MTIYLLEKSLIEIHVFVKFTVKRPHVQPNYFNVYFENERP